MREEREERARLERMQREGIPPPRRDDPDGTYQRYGPLAHNPEGDEAFRKDRCVWYEHVTGESLEGVSLAEQRRLTDVLARAWRVYNDGRVGKQRSGPKCVECHCNPCECERPPSDEEVEYTYDDY